MELKASTNSDHHFLKLHFHLQSNKIDFINFQPSLCEYSADIKPFLCARGHFVQSDGNKV